MKVFGIVRRSGPSGARISQVSNSGKRLEVAAVNLFGSIDDIRSSIDELAQRVRALRSEARRVRKAA